MRTSSSAPEGSVRLTAPQWAVRTTSAFTVAVVAVVAGGASPAMAAAEDPALAGAELVEIITGTEGVVESPLGDVESDVRVPLDASEPVILDVSDMIIAFGQPTSGDSELLITDAGTVTYANAEGAFDSHLQVLESPDESLLSDGVRSLIEIKDASAPREYAFPVDLPDGVQLELQDDGSVDGVDAAGEVRLVIPAPWAFDAEGYEVLTWYEVRGDELVQHVDFDETFAFPVVADPVWFVVVAVALHMTRHVVVRAATSAAARAAAARAAGVAASRASYHAVNKILNTVYVSVTASKLRSCGFASVAAGGQASYSVYLDYRDNGGYLFRTTNTLRVVSQSAVACLIGAAGARNLAK